MKTGAPGRGRAPSSVQSTDGTPPSKGVADGRPASPRLPYIRVGIQIERYHDVRRLRMTSLAGTAMGVEVSAYLLDGILIDTGFPRAARWLDSSIDALGIRGAIVTHSHEDHAGNVELLARRGIPVRLQGITEALLRRPRRLRLYRRLAWGVPRPLRSELRPLDANSFATIPTPGHSDDHTVVWHASSRTVFSGDLWLGVRYGVMHASEDPYRLIESLRVVKALEPSRMFDAHLGLVSHPVRAITAKIDWLTDTIARIETAIRAGIRENTIVDDVLRGEKLAAAVSFGEYASRNFVRAVRRHLAAPAVMPDRLLAETPSPIGASAPHAGRRDV